MFVFVVRQETICPACAFAAEEEGDEIAAKGFRLCRWHRSQFEALLRDVHAAQTTVRYWLRYAV